MLSLAEAAGLTGLNKTTLLRSIKSGRMTGSKDALGQWQVHEAELLRVYSLRRTQRASAAIRVTTQRQRCRPK